MMINIIFALCWLPIIVYCRITEDGMPKMLRDCYSGKGNKNDMNKPSNVNCLDLYLIDTFSNSTYHGLDKSALDWVDSLGQRLNIRLKRQSSSRKGRKRRLRKRKEIRTLSKKERKDFFDAVNALKQDKSQKPNKYDVLALLHQGAAIYSAHRGPNFLGWHRYFLCMFEEALRTKKRKIALPYWDSTLDFRMDDPKESILWTEMFFGNGIGVVFSGPFARWRTPANNTYLRRQLTGKPSSLIDPDKLRSVFTKKYHKEILPPTAAKMEDNIEEHHNGVHNWVGGLDGHMTGLDTAAMDPVFFLHHCFIDYLWEKFRKRQEKLYINSAKDYPAGDKPNQQPYRIMDNLTPLKQSIYGYSDYFTRYVYRYVDAPTCRNRCGCGYKGYLFCNRNYKCESRSRTGFKKTGGFSKNYINFSNIKASSSSIKSFMQPLNLRMSDGNTAPSMQRQFAAGIIDSRTAAK